METEITETADAVKEAAGVIERGVEAVAAQIADLAATYGEPAWDAVLLITQIEAAGRLVLASVLFFGISYAMWFSWRQGGWLREFLVKENVGEAWAACILASVVAYIPAGIGFFSLLRIWNWVALFAPELYLAKRALDAVVGL